MAVEREKALKAAEEEEKQRLAKAQEIIENAQKLAERVKQKRVENQV